MADRNLDLALRIRADLAQAKGELKSIETQVTSLGKAGKRSSEELAKVDPAKDAPRVVNELRKVNAAITETAVSVKKVKDAGPIDLGKNLPTQVPKIREADKALKGAALSAGELKNATRQIPAQFTDIVTSLSGGQSPLQVFIQQGGQLKDTFGSAGAAAAALGRYVLSLVNPYTVAAAAIATLGVAAYKGAQESQNFERALILTGNASETNAAQLGELASKLGTIGGATTSLAADALTKLAGTGQLSGEQLELAADAAVRWAAANVQSVDETVAQFEKIAKDPVQALLELNRTQNFLTQTQLDSIKTLVEQGDAQGAVTEAMRLYDDVVRERAPKVVANLGTIETGLKFLRDTAREVGDALLEIGRAPDLASARKTLDFAKAQIAQNPDNEFAKAMLAGAQQQLQSLLPIKIITGEQSSEKASEAREAAEKRIAAVRLRNLSDVQRLESDIKAIRKDGEAAGLEKSEIDALEAGARKKFADTRPKGPKAPKTDAQKDTEGAQRELENLRKQAALLDDLEVGEKRASEAARVRFEIEQGAYKNAEPALKAQLQAAATALDSGRRQVEVAKQLVDVKMRTMQLQGSGDQAQLDKTNGLLEKLRLKLLEVGKAAEAADVAKLMKLETAQAQVATISQRLQATQGQIDRDAQRVDIDRQNGLISSIEAQKRLLELRQREIEVIAQQIAATREAALALDEGSPRRAELLAQADQLSVRLEDLRAQGTLLATTLRNGFEEGLTNALVGLADGTLTLREALVGLVQDLASSLARLAAQQLASLATAKLFALINRGANANDVGAGAEKLSTAALATAAAGGAISLGATLLNTSASNLQLAALALTAANATGGGFGFAEGGYTGPGGKYQIAGYVHKGEGVLNQNEISALGGPGGFYALRGAIASGSLSGFDGASAPNAMAAPRFNFAEGGLAADAMPAPQVTMRNINLLDTDSLADAIFAKKAFETATLNIIGDNIGKISAQVRR